MINISEEQFEFKRKKETVFSVISEFRGDEITPIRIFNGFEGRKKFILADIFF